MIAATRTALHDALVSALDLPVDIGFPTAIQPNHVWISGDSRIEFEYPVTGGAPSTLPYESTFTLKLYEIRTAGIDFEALDALVQADVAAIRTCLDSLPVDRARITAIEYGEARDANGVRQLGFELYLECATF